MQPARDRDSFFSHLGMELLSAADGRSRLELEVLPRHLTGRDRVHGGVLMALLDVAMAVAGRSVAPEAARALTVEMKTTFLQAAPASGRLSATGLCVHRSNSLVFCEGEIRDQDSRLIARASGTFKYLRRPPPEEAPGAG